MDPVTFNLSVSRGSPISEELIFVDENDDPIDMTGYEPFVWQVRRFSEGPLLLEVTVDDSNIDEGKIHGTATIAQTQALPTGTLLHDLLDVAGTKWFTGTFEVDRNISKL